MNDIYIGKRVQQVPGRQHPERSHMQKRYGSEDMYKPQTATIVYINRAHRTYTLRYDKTGLLETLKG